MRNGISENAFILRVNTASKTICKCYGEMTIHTRSYEMRRLPRTRNIMLWLQTLRRNIPRNWAEISLHERRSFFHRNYLGMRSYFPKLQGLVIRLNCLYYAVEYGTVHHYDLYSSMCRLSAAELNTLMNRLLTKEFCELFELFLQWPFQIIFLDVVKLFERYISKDIFEGVVNYILRCELGMGLQDHMYVEIFKPFWNLFSARYEKGFKKNVQLYNLAKYVLESSKNYDLSTYRNLLDLNFPDSTVE
ncbi:uncharacterized protein TNCT_227201 [Trichonephila clavata]|uniref:Uncharacterized protein n=1 Tax=Trichonephila clavata TaxID=2740835 RepID=A0A8X6LNJ6_TRICU|nr:uncharacterized protein TNCT_227201 [Trichonephila clavata]